MEGGNLGQNNRGVEGSLIDPEKKKDYEERIWRRAEEFSMIRQALEARLKEMDELFLAKPTASLNLHESEERADEENEYWETKEKIDEIKSEEDRLEESLISLGQGTAVESDLEILVPAETEEEKTISKRKQRILEEKKRLGLDPRGIMSEMYGEFGQEKMRLTTGRHAKGVKNLGSIDPLSAAYAFYHNTTDTHGGKVAHGKRGPSYVSSSGKRIRKK